MSCTRTFFDASRITLTTRATLASKYKPSGIIPITAATIDVILLLKDAPEKKNCCPKSNSPIGIINIPTTPTNLSRTLIISDCSSLFIALASSVNFDIYESSPTLSSLA